MSDNALFLSFHAKLEVGTVQSVSTVGAGFVAGLLEAVARLGITRADLLQRADLDPQALDGASARLAVVDVIALFDAAVALSGRGDIGLEFARHVRPGTFHVLGYALMTCKTLGEAIALVPHYRRLVFDIGYSEMRLASHGQDVWLGWHVLPPAHVYSATLAEALIASWYVFGRWIAGALLPLKEVRFTHRAPADVAAYQQFFDCPVRFAPIRTLWSFRASCWTCRWCRPMKPCTWRCASRPAPPWRRRSTSKTLPHAYATR